jgi:hypothetical protein
MKDLPHGRYRDVVRDPAGRITWDSGVHDNVIVADCRRLLAAFLHGPPTTTAAITGLRVGQGDPAWDQPPGPPPTSPAQTGLADPHPFLVPRADLTFTYLTGDVASADPTNRLRIHATLGPHVPDWPDPATGHPTGTLREFGLVATLQGGEILLDYVIHQAIVKDPDSTLERSIWLVF